MGSKMNLNLVNFESLLVGDEVHPKQLAPNDLPNMLDELEVVINWDMVIQGLDFVIKSFEGEILIRQVSSVLDMSFKTAATPSVQF